MSGPVRIICSRWTPAALRRVPGNRRAKCDHCGGAIVVSPQGRRIVRDANAELVCMPCALRADPDAIAEPVPGAIEVAQELCLPHARELADWLAARPLREVLPYLADERPGGDS